MLGKRSRIPQETNELFKKHYVALPEEAIEGSLEREEDMDLDRFVRDGLAGVAISFDAIIGSTEVITHNTAITIAKRTGDDTHNAADDMFESIVEEKHRHVVEIRVPDNAKKSLNILFVNSSKGLAAKVKIIVGKRADLSLLEWYSSAGDNISFAGVIHSVEAGDGSNVEINALHNEGKSTISASYFNGSVGENAKLFSNGTYIGGSHVRVRNVFDADTDGSSIEANEIALGAGEQKFDLMSRISNIGKNTRAVLNSTAVMDDSATCFLKGYAKIYHGAKSAFSNIHQEGLLLSKDSKITALPDMSIDESDVKATHAASAGPLEEDKLFYMMSRGIKAKSAKELITAAFLTRVISKIRNPIAKELAMSMVSKKINDGSYGNLPEMQSVGVWDASGNSIVIKND